METTKELSEDDKLQFEEMKIKIQTFDNNFPLVIRRNASVAELKEKIRELTNIPGEKQRLIFQGKLLQQNDKLSNYKITDDNVIHLVAKTLDNQENSSNATLSSQNTNEHQNTGLDEIYNGIIEIPIIRTNRRSRRRRVPQFDISESFESMHQNVLSLKNMQTCQYKFDNEQIIASKAITGFDFAKTKYEVGQWVDVKDTINQWLEAQVIQVRGNQAYVHYNGWGNRWDEWIEFSSPRIAPFKTYTVQSPNSIYLSPYPTVVPDANVVSQKRSIDTFYYMEKSADLMNHLSRSIEIMTKLRKSSKNEFKFDETKSEEENNKLKKEEEIRNCKQIESQGNQLNAVDNELLFLCSQIIPMMDRTGRLMSDIALHLSHLLMNSNLYPQFFLGYMINSNQNERISGNNESSQLNANTSNTTHHNANINSNFYSNPLNILNSIFPNLQQNSQNINNTANIQSAQQNINITENVNNQQQNQSRVTIQTNLPSNFNLSQINSILSQLSPSQNNFTNFNNFSVNTNHTQTNQIENSSLNNSSRQTEIESNIFKDNQTENKDSNNLLLETNLNNKNDKDDLSNTNIPINNETSNNEETITHKKSIDEEGTIHKYNSNLKTFRDSLPKINLQVPAILSPGEITQMGNMGSVEPNIDIYVHTFVAQSNRNMNSNQQNQSNQNTNTNQSNSNNSSQTNNHESTTSQDAQFSNVFQNQQNNRFNNYSTLHQYAALLESMSSLLANNPRRNENNSNISGSNNTSNDVPNNGDSTTNRENTSNTIHIVSNRIVNQNETNSQANNNTQQTNTSQDSIINPRNEQNGEDIIIENSEEDNSNKNEKEK